MFDRKVGLWSISTFKSFFFIVWVCERKITASTSQQISGFTGQSDPCVCVQRFCPHRTRAAVKAKTPRGKSFTIMTDLFTRWNFVLGGPSSHWWLSRLSQPSARSRTSRSSRVDSNQSIGALWSHLLEKTTEIFKDKSLEETNKKLWSATFQTNIFREADHRRRQFGTERLSWMRVWLFSSQILSRQKLRHQAEDQG